MSARLIQRGFAAIVVAWSLYMLYDHFQAHAAAERAAIDNFLKALRMGEEAKYLHKLAEDGFNKASETARMLEAEVEQRSRVLESARSSLLKLRVRIMEFEEKQDDFEWKELIHKRRIELLTEDVKARQVLITESSAFARTAADNLVLMDEQVATKNILVEQAPINSPQAIRNRLSELKQRADSAYNKTADQTSRDALHSIIDDLNKLTNTDEIPPGKDLTAPISAVIVYIATLDDLPALKQSLTSLEQNFLRCFSYPVVVFMDYEKARDDTAVDDLKSYVPSAESFKIENVCLSTCLPPGHEKLNATYGLPNNPIASKLLPANIAHFVCTQLASHPAVTKYEYILRLDARSFINSPVPEDIFARFQASKCLYGYSDIKQTPNTSTQKSVVTVVDRYLQGDNEPVEPTIRPPKNTSATGVPAAGKNGIIPQEPQVTGRRLLAETIPVEENGRLSDEVRQRFANVVGIDVDVPTALSFERTFELFSKEPFLRLEYTDLQAFASTVTPFFTFKWDTESVRMITLPVLLPMSNICHIDSGRLSATIGGSVVPTVKKGSKCPHDLSNHSPNFRKTTLGSRPQPPALVYA